MLKQTTMKFQKRQMKILTINKINTKIKQNEKSDIISSFVSING